LGCFGGGGIRRHDFKYRLFSLNIATGELSEGNGKEPRLTCRLERHQRRFLSSHYHRNAVVTGLRPAGELTALLYICSAAVHHSLSFAEKETISDFGLKVRMMIAGIKRRITRDKKKRDHRSHTIVAET